MKINAHIFREYDIRGIVENDFTGDVPYLIGRAYGSEVRARLGGTPRVAVGHDNRPSSPHLAKEIIRGIRSAGVDVIDIGTAPTPMLYYATEKLKTDGGLQITGSHNPPEYNGFKMVVRGRALYGEAIQGLHKRIENDDLLNGSGSYKQQDIRRTYIDDVGGRFKVKRPLKVVVDCGNGTGSLVAVEMLAKSGAQIIPLYCDSDGTFPNHHPDPVVDANLRDMIALVKKEKADIGIAFDGDADRIGAVDEKGNIIRGDILLLLYAMDALKRLGAPQKLIFDVKCTQALTDVYEAAGGVPIMWKTGHSLIKEKMKEEHAPIAGELSGHICFGEDYYGFDDALYGGCLLIQLVSRSSRPLSAMVDEFPKYVSTAEIRVEVTEETKFGIVDRAIEHFRANHEVIDVDGARVLFDGGWGLVRASNTQPVLVLRFEARTQEQLDKIQHTMYEWMAAQGVDTSATAAH
ncbi:MAG TPA: phosphomannomutase/phosphoglucomutase [Longimicrobiales bacterium]|nr:phosphomannomutase/phosphoglucomutase [Longimicrobiales bacterium]